jgi:hypothetical protein
VIFEIAACIVIVASIAIATRYYWITRRQPVRKDAPVDGPWVAPTWRR